MLKEGAYTQAEADAAAGMGQYIRPDRLEIPLAVGAAARVLAEEAAAIAAAEKVEAIAQETGVTPAPAPKLKQWQKHLAKAVPVDA